MKRIETDKGVIIMPDVEWFGIAELRLIDEDRVMAVGPFEGAAEVSAWVDRHRLSLKRLLIIRGQDWPMPVPKDVVHDGYRA